MLINRTQAARYEINVEDIQELIELAIGGRTISTLYEGERRFAITARYDPEARPDSTAMSPIQLRV